MLKLGMGRAAPSAVLLNRPDRSELPEQTGTGLSHAADTSPTGSSSNAATWRLRSPRRPDLSRNSRMELIGWENAADASGLCIGWDWGGQGRSSRCRCPTTYCLRECALHTERTFLASSLSASGADLELDGRPSVNVVPRPGGWRRGRARPRRLSGRRTEPPVAIEELHFASDN